MTFSLRHYRLPFLELFLAAKRCPGHWLAITLLLCCFYPVLSLAATPAEKVKITSIQADFTQEKHLKILAKPIVSKGSFTFQSPQSLRWQYTSPVPSILLMHGGQVEKYIKDKNGSLIKDQGMGLSSMQVVLAEITNWLDGRFSDNDMFKVSFPDDSTILLTAKNKGLAGLISRITLRRADEKGLLESVTITEGPDSYTTMYFTDSHLNQDIPATVFTKP